MKSGFLLLLMIFSSACFAGEIVDYRVEGTLTGPLKGKYAYLQVKANALQRSQLLKATIQNGRFAFSGVAKCETGHNCFATLFISDNPGFVAKDIVSLIKSSNNDMRSLMLEANVSVDVSHFLKEAIVKGGELNAIHNLFVAVELKEYNLNVKTRKEYDEQKKRYAGNAIMLEKALAEYMQQTIKNQDGKISGICRLISEYPTSKEAMSRFMMMPYVNDVQQGKYTALLQDTWSHLPESVKNTKEGKDIFAMITKAPGGSVLKEGNLMPDYSFVDDKGSTVSVKKYKGQYLFIDFWTSWCTPCIAQHYYMRKAYEKFKGSGFSIFQVSMDEKKEKWLKGLKDHQLPWTNVWAKGWNKEVEKLFNIDGVPTNYLIAPDGKIIAKNLRGEELEKKLATLLIQ